MEQIELAKLMNGRKAIQAIMKEGYQIEVSDYELELALKELRNVAAQYTNSDEHKESGFTIQKFKILQDKYSLIDRLRVKTNSEVARVYSMPVKDDVSQICNDGLQELYKIIKKIKSKSTVIEYPKMHGIKIAKK